MELEAVVVFPWTLLSCPAVLTVAKHCCCAIASSDVSSGEAHYTTLPKEPVSRSYAMAASSAVLKVSRVVKLLRWWQDREQLCRSNGGGT
uniref:Secreted protein n=1 Tax=Oryza nivara TaxID=4536 RepID=A0A0E0HSA7_ORYNI